jgi:hypothetical protein
MTNGTVMHFCHRAEHAGLVPAYLVAHHPRTMDGAGPVGAPTPIPACPLAPGLAGCQLSTSVGSYGSSSAPKISVALRVMAPWGQEAAEARHGITIASQPHCKESNSARGERVNDRRWKGAVAVGDQPSQLYELWGKG